MRSIPGAAMAVALGLCLGCTSTGADEQTRLLSVDRAAVTSTTPTATASPGADETRRLTASTSAPLQATTQPGTSARPETSTRPGTSVDDAGATRPDWLGQRPLPTTPEGRVVVPQTTPEELRNRRFPTIDTLPPPPDDRFTAELGPVPDEVLTRSTWVDGCPVPAEDLRYLTLSFWGFDGQPHTGELIVNGAAANDIVSVFRALHQARFPLEEMRVVSPEDLAAEPTGDGNNTTAFVCRPVTGGTEFSQHAYGLAIDVNPFHNPYLRGDLLLPELSADYLDRTDAGPGAVTAGDVVVEAFAEIGWSWGGDWESLKDYQHFSLENR